MEARGIVEMQSSSNRQNMTACPLFKFVTFIKFCIKLLCLQNGIPDVLASYDDTNKRLYLLRKKLNFSLGTQLNLIALLIRKI